MQDGRFLFYEEQKMEATMNSKIKMQFDPKVAKKVGTDAAIILSNIEYWVFHNKTNGTNYYDGCYWTYNSLDAFAKQFAYLTAKQIRTCLKKLEDNGYIKTGNFNKSKYDHTKWYTTISPNDKIDLPKKSDRLNQMVNAIPYNKTQIENSNDKYMSSSQSMTGDLKDLEFKKQAKELFDYWAKLNGKDPSRFSWLKTREDKAVRRLRQFGYDDIKKAIENAHKDYFYGGNNQRHWRADFDWIVKSDVNVDKLRNLEPRPRPMSWAEKKQAEEDEELERMIRRAGM